MSDRSAGVAGAVQLLAHAGMMDAALAYASLSQYANDMRAERRAAYAKKDVKMVEMFNSDIAKAQEVIDALEIAMLTM